MKAIIVSSELVGVISAPTSKSYLQRGLAAALLTEGTTRLYFNNHCDDTIAALNIIKSLGAGVEILNDGLLIRGGLKVMNNNLDCNESGLSMRMFSPIAALTNQELTLSANGSLSSRPQELIVNSLSKFGVEVKSSGTFPPVIVKGPIKPGKVEIDGSVSSQLISGLLLALPLLNDDSEVTIKNIVSHKYIDMTIDILNTFGVLIKKPGYGIYSIRGRQKYIPANYKIEGDWSGASFFIVGALIKGDVRIQGLNIHSLQADKEILQLLSDKDYEYTFKDGEFRISKHQLTEFEFDATNCPDLFPPLFALAANSSGISKIKGVHRLKFKESNRAQTLINEFIKLGISSYIEDDILFIKGGSIKSGTVLTHNDHRIGMALSIVCLNSSGNVIIKGVECVNKSYPGFFDDLRTLGGSVVIVK